MKNSIIYALVMLALQAITGLIVTAIWQKVTGVKDVTTGMLVTSSVVFSVTTIVVFFGARWARLSPNWLRTRQFSVLFWSVIAALGAIIPSIWMQEQMPELPNIVESQFDMILSNRWGYLVIGLLAPLTEEIVVRGCVLRDLLKSPKLTPLWAIVVSAVIFSLLHVNPAQMPHAFVIGLLLGWMYWRTGSILPGVAYHWANNSMAYILYNLYPNPDLTLLELFKGSQQHVYMSLAFSLLILLPALYQLNMWMRRADEKRNC
jgi:membrane protease YdiL (CAAX protease family)